VKVLPAQPPRSRTLAALALVALAAAASLRAADELALRLGGGRRGVVRHASVERAEARLHERLLLPAFFPDDLEWPPAEVLSAGRPPVVCLGFASRAAADRHAERARLCQSREPSGGWPRALVADAAVVRTWPLELEGAEARASLLRLTSGESAGQLEWRHADRRLLLRFRGSFERASRLAASLRGTRP
jgi:hypothetical protein